MPRSAKKQRNNDGVNHFDRLPEDLRLAILSFLPLPQIIKVQCCSKAWLHSAWASRTSFNFKDLQVHSEASAFQLLSRLTRVQEITMPKFCTVKMLSSLPTCVKKLNLSDVQTPCSIANPKHFIESFGHLSQLSELRLSNLESITEACLDIVHRNAPFLKSLWINGCPKISGSYLFTKGAWPTQLKTLVCTETLAQDLIVAAGDNKLDVVKKILQRASELQYDMKVFVNAFVDIPYPIEADDIDDLRHLPPRIIRTALHRAARWNNVEMIELLFSYEADVNSYSPDDNMTPMIIACSRGHLETVHLLIARNADLRAVTKDGSTAIHCAAMSSSDELIQLLLNYCDASDLNRQCGESETTPLYWCCQDGKLELLKQMLEKGGNPNIGAAQLYAAVFAGNIDIVRLLLEHPGVDVNKTEDTFTPLYCACYKGYTEIVRLLLEHNADPHILPSAGASCLFVAARHNNVEIVKLLLDAGADPQLGEVSTKNKQSPFNVAFERGYLEVSNAIMDAIAKRRFGKWRKKTQNQTTTTSPPQSISQPRHRRRKGKGRTK